MTRRSSSKKEVLEVEDELLESEEEDELSSDDEDYEESSGSEPEVTLNILERQPRVTAGT